jgi:hypothetical protein
MSADPPRDNRVSTQSIGTFLKRLFWRRDIGPISTEAQLEVRELTTDLEVQSEPEAKLPPA